MAQMTLDDLIAALASPPGPAVRGIIRICGNTLRETLASWFDADDPSAWNRCRSAARFTGTWRLSDTSLRIPCAVMFWPTSRSYTGQPTAEVHLPGSPPLLERVLEDLYRDGVRPARPGEFTLRAFLGGKIDLVQAEAVLGVIDAHDDAELRTALDQLAGGISRRLAELRFDLIDLLSDLEAGLDFVEEDIEFVTREELSSRVAEARRFVESLLGQSSSRMTSATKPKVVLAGLPNAGKSTLFNHLTGQSLALVSEVQGTTRDYLQAEMTCHGVACELIDTAGWEDQTAGISGAAQNQRTDQLHRAALVLWCSACDQVEQQQLSDGAAYQQSCAELTSILRVWTKSDIPSGGRQPPDCAFRRGDHNPGADAPRSEDVFVSAQAEIGLDELRQRIAERLAGSGSRASAWLGMTAARCRDSLTQAASALLRAETAVNTASHSEELLAVDLREALDHLGIIVGAVYTDDLLDRIFSKFCIGK